MRILLKLLVIPLFLFFGCSNKSIMLLSVFYHNTYIFDSRTQLVCSPVYHLSSTIALKTPENVSIEQQTRATTTTTYYIYLPMETGFLMAKLDDWVHRFQYVLIKRVYGLVYLLLSIYLDTFHLVFLFLLLFICSFSFVISAYFLSIRFAFCSRCPLLLMLLHPLFVCLFLAI